MSTAVPPSTTPSSALPASAAPANVRPGTALSRLTSLRAFAALAVFVTHLGRWDVATLPHGASQLGYSGVAFFFVLSGFILTWSTRPGTSPLTFYRRRFARVWPSHAVMLAVAALVPVVAVDRSWQLALPNLLLVQSWGSEQVAYAMNGVSWSLSCEAFFYALFPALIWLATCSKTPRTKWLLLAALATCLLLGLAAAVLWPKAAFYVPLFRLPEFLLGIAVGVAFKNGWRPRVHPVLAGLALAGAAVVALSLPKPLPDFVFLVPFVLVLLWAAGRDLEGRRGWLTSPVLVWAGEASFAFYLVHELVILNLRSLVGTGWLAVIALLAVAVLAAALLHHGVERPMNLLLRGRRPARARAHATPPDSPQLPTQSQPEGGHSHE